MGAPVHVLQVCLLNTGCSSSLTVYFQIDKLKLRIFSIFLHIPPDFVAALVSNAVEAAEDRRSMIRNGEDELGLEKQDAPPHRIHVRSRGILTDFDFCDTSVRQMDWRCLKRAVECRQREPASLLSACTHTSLSLDT